LVIRLHISQPKIKKEFEKIPIIENEQLVGWLFETKIMITQKVTEE
jgi:hypothetical protein